MFLLKKHLTASPVLFCALFGIALLAACGRGGGGAPSPSEGQATLGAAGGVVQGPDGVTVEVPAGALASDVTLRVARDGTGAPPPPTGFEAFGSTYQFTPHGQLFEVPATISLPVNVAALPADAAPLFFHAQPGDQWIQIVDAQLDGDRLRAPSLSFSYGNVYIGYFDASIPLAQRHTVKQFSLVAPTGLPLANGWLPTVSQPTTVTIRVEMDPGFVSRRCSASPTIELARAIKTVTDNNPPPSWAYQPVGSQLLGTNAWLDFNVPLDNSHNGTDWFIAKFDCPLRPEVGPVGGYRWFLFGYVRVKVDISLPPGAPAITQQPQSVTTDAGTAATFTLAASAPDTLVVQWQRSDDNGANWATVASGVNLTSYTLNPVQVSDNGARFRANVCSQLGMQLNCITSNVATLTVTSVATAPVFITQPQSIAVQSGQTASFTAVASGNPAPSVQWYQVGSPADLAVGTPCIAGAGVATSCTYTTPPLAVNDSGSQYYALAYNSAGNTPSNTVTVTVTASAAAPSITTEPADQSVTEGGTASFAVVADGTAPLSYQWYRNGQLVGGASGASITLTNVQLSENGDQYYVVVSNGEGDATSVTVTLTVTAAGGACGVPQLIDSGTGVASEPDIVMDAAGNATAVWSQEGNGAVYRIHANRYSAGSGWGTAQPISLDYTHARGARLAMDGGGNVVVVWEGPGSVFANRYTAGSGWGASEVRLDSTIPDYNSNSPAVAFANSGAGVAVWQEYDGVTDSIYASHYTPGSGWSAPGTIDSDGFHPANSPDVGMDANGNAIAVWRQSEGATYSLFANRYNGSEWGTAQAIENLTGEVVTARIAMNATGQAVAVWSQNNGAAYGVYAAVYTPGSGWGAPSVLDPGTTQSVVPVVAIDGNGAAIAVWEQWDGSGHRIYARRYVPGSGWAAIAQLQSPNGSDAWEPQVVMDASGNAIVVWMQWQTTSFGIFGNRYTPGSGWGGATLLANATDNVSTPRAALNGSGTAVVVWREGDGTSLNIKALRCQ